ncbi:hypothetical protein SAMN05421642_13018 [Rhodococcoides kyotonense]|uniref:Uncharacterized protein n=1 Tax=Rhodococcoides kyotonense TaxID=398843 RepID=A0A239N693_9NOCA|nr:hypothetical protein SAMN05421642_13018 [Rhodococcus kyotonensis]
MLLASFVAVVASKLSLGYDSTQIEQSDLWFKHFVTPQWSGFVVVVTALLAILLQRNNNGRRLPIAAALTGAAVIAMPSVVPIMANQAVTVTAAGSGLLLAASTLVAVANRCTQLCVIVGVFSGVLFWGAIHQHIPADENRWMVTLGPSPVDAAVHPIILAFTAVAIALAARRGDIGVVGPDRRAIAGLLAVSSVFLLVYVFLGSKMSSTPVWIVSVIVVGAATTVATRLLPVRDRTVVWTGFGVAAASVSGLAWNQGSWWVVVVGVAALAAGICVANWTRRPWLGILLLAAVTISGLLTGSASLDIIPTIAYAVVFPAAVGYSAASSVPKGTAAAVFGSTIPLSVALFSVSAPATPATFYWSNGAESSPQLPVVAAVSPLPIGILIATLAIVVAGVATARPTATNGQRASFSS